METYVITAYVITDEVIRILKIQDDPQSILSNAEVIPLPLSQQSSSPEISRWPDIAVKR